MPDFSRGEDEIPRRASAPWRISQKGSASPFEAFCPSKYCNFVLSQRYCNLIQIIDLIRQKLQISLQTSRECGEKGFLWDDSDARKHFWHQKYPLKGFKHITQTTPWDFRWKAQEFSETPPRSLKAKAWMDYKSHHSMIQERAPEKQYKNDGSCEQARDTSFQKYNERSNKEHDTSISGCLSSWYGIKHHIYDNIQQKGNHISYAYDTSW